MVLSSYHFNQWSPELPRHKTCPPSSAPRPSRRPALRRRRPAREPRSCRRPRASTRVLRREISQTSEHGKQFWSLKHGTEHGTGFSKLAWDLAWTNGKGKRLILAELHHEGYPAWCFAAAKGKPSPRLYRFVSGMVCQVSVSISFSWKWKCMEVLHFMKIWRVSVAFLGNLLSSSINDHGGFKAPSQDEPTGIPLKKWSEVKLRTTGFTVSQNTWTSNFSIYIYIRHYFV